MKRPRLVSYDTFPFEWVTPPELASYVQCDPRTIVRMIAVGVLPAFKVGKCWRILISDARRAFPSTASKSICSRCSERPRRPGQRWCGECRAVYMQQHREAASRLEWQRCLEGEQVGDEHSGVYFVECAGYIKIGLASDVRARMRSIQASNPLPVVLLVLVTVGVYAEAERLEKTLHSAFRDQRVRGEWFRDSPSLRACIANRAASFFHVERAS